MHFYSAPLCHVGNISQRNHQMESKAIMAIHETISR